MTMTSVLNILTGIFESILAVMFISAYSDRNTKIAKHPYILVLPLAVTIDIINHFAGITILNIMLIALALFAASYLLTQRIKISIIITVVMTAIFLLTEILTLFIITWLTGLSAEQATVQENYRILGTVLSKLFAFIVLKITSLKVRINKDSAVKTSYWILFFVMFSTVAIAIYLLFILQYNSNHIATTYKQLTVWCAFGLLYTTFFTLYLYERISQKAEMEKKQEVFRQQISAQSKYLEDILINQKELKKFRHDFANHSIALKSFFENQDYPSGLKYMENMMELIYVSGDSIETGNAALDAIISTKKKLAESKGIEFETNIQVPEQLFVDAVDLCIVFGNALDNSIEACERIQSGQKRIVVSIIYEDDSLICKISNTTERKSKIGFLTAKRDSSNHGFGIANIKSALSKYKNICRFTETDHEFILSFIIFKS